MRLFALFPLAATAFAAAMAYEPSDANAVAIVSPVSTALAASLDPA
jgi:hypothetical protein